MSVDDIRLDPINDSNKLNETDKVLNRRYLPRERNGYVLHSFLQHFLNLRSIRTDGVNIITVFFHITKLSAE